MATEPTDLPVHLLSRELAERRLSSLELTQAFLARIGRLDPKLHAFVRVYAEEALEAAAAADRAIRSGRSLGPFHGVPIAVKDVVDLAGRVAMGGSKNWAERIGPATATVVQKLLAAGLIVLGKTHTVEFAMGGWGTNQQLGAPWNPWDMAVQRCPGGSSSGSGVAVAARLAPWAIGTDTGGSVRLPSAYCGGVGLKTTLGRISGHGILPMSPTLDSPGAMTRSVEDAALLFRLLQGPDPLDPSTLSHPPDDPLPSLKRGAAGLRLGVLPPAEREGVDAEVLAAYDEAVAVLTRQGARPVPVSLPLSFAAYGNLAGFIITTEIYSLLGEFAERSELPLDEDVRPRVLSGRGRSAADYLRALRERQDRIREFEALFAGMDALLTPTTATPAIPLAAIDQKTMPTQFTRWVGYLSLPALALPNGLTRAGLPTSLQIVCRRHDEATALRLGWAYEQATDWHRLRPPGIL